MTLVIRKKIPDVICNIIAKFVGTDILTKRLIKLFNDPESSDYNLNRLNISFDIFELCPGHLIYEVIARNPYITTKRFLDEKLYLFLRTDGLPVQKVDNKSWQYMTNDKIIRNLVKILHCDKCQSKSCNNIDHVVNWKDLHENQNMPVRYILNYFPNCVMWDKIPYNPVVHILMKHN